MIELIVPAVVVTAVLLFCAAKSSGRVCPTCESKLPVIRKPSSLRQLLWGGWTCPVCTSEIDRKGKLISG